MRSSAKYRPSEISHVSTDDRFAAVANCYGDEAVAQYAILYVFRFNTANSHQYSAKPISYLFFLSLFGY